MSKHKISIFSYSLLPKILKLRRSSLRLVFLIKILYNQFLLLKNYRLWHWIRILMRINHILFSLIWNSLYLISPQSHKFPIGVESVKFYKVWNKKGSVKKKKTTNNRSRVFVTSLERVREWKGGGNGNFSWESFNHSMLLSF